MASLLRVFAATAEGLTLTASVRDETGAALAVQPDYTIVEHGDGLYSYFSDEMPEGEYLTVQILHGDVVEALLEVSPLAVVLSLSAAQVQAAAAVGAGATISIFRGDTWSQAITGLSDLTGNDKLWFTVKRRKADADSRAIIQIERTVGLVRLNGGAAIAGDGALVVDDAAAGEITVSLVAAATAELEPRTELFYDLQMLDGTTVTTLAEGRLDVTADVTEAVS